MIQRKQTLFLLVALILNVVCLCFPIGSFEPMGMGISPVLFNIGLKDATGILHFNSCVLFMFLVITSVLSITAIFLYKKRKLQSKLCWWSFSFSLGWYAYLSFFVFNEMETMGSHVHPSFGICLPLIAIILYLMANQGIIRDDKLVRAADRIR